MNNKMQLQPAPICQGSRDDSRRKEAVQELITAQKQLQEQRHHAALDAAKRLPLLVDACACKTGQSYVLRALLFSLWNGKPVDLSETLRLDWELKKSLCVVLVAFGFERGENKFFYDAIANAFKARGLFDWFRAEGDEA